jgi:Zn-dependent protease/CBS domain-containing protein
MRSFRIGSVFGIPIRLDATLLLVLPVFAWLIGSQVDVSSAQLNRVFGLSFDPAALTAGLTPWILGTAVAVGLFAAILLHELGHSAVAMRFGFPIDSITLWILGGIAQLSDQPEDWRQELLIAVAGPAVSLVVAALAWGALRVTPPTLDQVQFVFAYLSLMNVVLAAFNLIPAFPMDGGRVLRALLARTRPFAQATQTAAEVGKVFALLLGLAGLLWLSNLFLVLVAFFIYIGASSEAQRITMNAAFEGVEVRDVMTPAEDVDAVAPDVSLADLAERMFRERHTGYPVMNGDSPAGMVTLQDVQSVDEVERDAFIVEDVMSADLATVAPDASAMEAFETMQREGIGRLLVVEDDELVGLLSRTDLMTAFDIIRNTGSTADAPAADADADAGGLSDGTVDSPPRT